MTKKVKRPKNLKHKRVNDILLGPLERPAIAYLVKILPKWVTPDVLTFTGLFAGFLVFASYYLTNYNKAFLWLASFGLILNWFGDSLDGSMARYRKIERPRFGFYIDHNIDALVVSLIMLGMGISPYTHFHIAVLPLIMYLMMEVQAVAALYANNIFKISYGKLGPTEARAIAILLNAMLFFVGSPRVSLFGSSYLILDVILVLISVLIFVLFVYSVAKVGRTLSRMESQSKEPQPVAAKIPAKEKA
jgi:archaetidylinositol phosphate synthase